MASSAANPEMTQQQTFFNGLMNFGMIAEPIGSASSDRALCQLCGLCKGCETPFMRPFVPKGWLENRLLLCIGEGPGEDEDERSGRQFTGRSGHLLRDLLAKAGFSIRDVAFTNAVRCRPQSNRTPSLREVRACRPFVLEAITRLRPRYVLGLGAIALACFLNQRGTGSVTQNRGKRLILPGLGVDEIWRPLISVTYHPSSVLRGAVELEAKILEDLKRLTTPGLEYPKNEIPRGLTLGFDTEYAPDGELLTAAVADRAHAWAIDSQI